MANLSGMVVVSVSPFTGSAGEKASPDKNGKSPVILTALAGKIPSKRILSGTIADNMSLIPGKAYLVSYNEGDEDPEFGRQFTWANAGVVTPVEVVAMLPALGQPQTVPVMDIVVVDNKPATEKVG